MRVLLSTSRHNVDAVVYGGFGRPFSVEVSAKNGVMGTSSTYSPTPTRSPWLWVADYSPGALILLNRATGERRSILEGQWKGPHCICRDPDNEITVVDYRGISLHTVKSTGLTFEKRDLITPSSGLVKGPATSQWHKDQLYVADYGSNRILIFDRAGQKLQEIEHDFDRPHDICFFSDSLVVVDTWHGRLQRFSLDFTFQEMISFPFQRPVSISRSEKYIAVSDVATHRIYLFDFHFRLLDTLGVGNELLKPYEVRFRDDSLFICDSDHGRILEVAEKELLSGHSRN